MRDARLRDRVLLALLPIVLGLGSATFARAEWTVELRPVQMEVHGHDQHVLTVHGIDVDATPAVDDATAVSLETLSDLGFASTGPDEVLFYRVLEDTDLEIWTLNLYALRELTRLDASSSYDRMMGPLVGVAATVEPGRHSIDAYLGQSLLLGTAETLSSTSGRFTVFTGFLGIVRYTF